MVVSPYAYGSMRATRLVSDSCTWLGARKPRLRLVDFFVRMCDLKACPALNLPEAVLRNRLAAARLVLIFGMLPLRSGFRDWPGRRSCDRAFHPCPCRLVVRQPMLQIAALAIRRSATDGCASNFEALMLSPSPPSAFLLGGEGWGEGIGLRNTEMLRQIAAFRSLTLCPRFANQRGCSVLTPALSRSRAKGSDRRAARDIILE